MSLQQISQQFRATRDKLWCLAAESLGDISGAIKNVYVDMGWFQITPRSSGIQQDVLQAKVFNVLTGNGATIGATIYAEGNATFIRLSGTRGLNIVDVLQAIEVIIASGDIGIFAMSDPLQRLASLNGVYDAATGDFQGSSTLLGGTTPNTLATQFTEATKNYLDGVMTFVDAVDGNAEVHTRLTAASGVEVSFKKGSDNEVSLAIGNLIVTWSIKNATHTTTVKPESVATSRLGVGAAPPATDGHALVNTFLGTGGATSASAGESLRVGGDARVNGKLGVAMSPTETLDVTGTFKVSGAATFDSTVTVTPLASGDVLVGQVAGVLTTIDPATARFLLDVYTKAEVDAAIAAAIAAIVVGNALVGTPEEHSHSLS